MKLFLRYSLAITVAFLLILLIKPLVTNQKEHIKYNFEVSSLNGTVKKEDFNGKVLAIYFGYMYCPDVCPTSLSSLAFALSNFSSEQLNGFRGLFISVDPERDGIKELDEYAKYFHKHFIGATSTKENIDDITKRYESFYEKIYLKDSKMNYSVSHTSYIYIFNKKGEFVKKVDHFTNPSELTEVLSKLL
ncbi:MAG: SCO family protein [Arcobacteraceae bacterium]